MTVDFDRICDFVEGCFAPNSELAKMTLIEMGIDPNTRRPTPVAADASPVKASVRKVTRPGILIDSDDLPRR